MPSTDLLIPPTPREQLKVGKEPLSLTFATEDWSYKRTRKSQFTKKAATRLFHPVHGYLPIDWKEYEKVICDGVIAKWIDFHAEDDDWHKGSSEINELKIEASACPLFIEVHESTHACGRDGESNNWTDRYWIEVLRDDAEELT